MKNLGLIFLFFLGETCMAQVDFDRLRMEKYWRYRDNFNKHFNVRSPNVGEPGVNYPAVDVLVEGSERVGIDFGDANANLGHYFMLLATEYKVLKNSGQAYYNTLAELYTALLSFERLDEYSEAWHRYRRDLGNPNRYNVRPDFNGAQAGYHQTGDANGWFIRGDQDQFFLFNYESKLGINSSIRNYSYNSKNDAIMANLTDGWDEGGLYPHVMSQDIIFNLMPALAIIKKVMDQPEYLGYCQVNHDSRILSRLQNAGIILPNFYVDFELWVNNIVYRFMSQIKHPPTQPTLKLFHEPGDPFSCEEFSADPCLAATENLPWWLQIECPISVQDPFCNLLDTRWYLRYPTSIKPHSLNNEGNGSDFDTHFIFNYGMAEASNSICSDGANFHEFGSNNGINQSLYSVLFSLGSVQQIKNVLNPISGLLNPISNQWIDDFAQFIYGSGGYKVRLLGSVFDYGGAVNYEMTKMPLINDEPYEQIPLIWYFLHPDNKIIPQEFVYIGLLSSAPCSGCRNYLGSGGYHYDWSSNSRLVNPHERGINLNTTQKERSGMDYMIEHNLFCLVFPNRKLVHLETEAYQTHIPSSPLSIPSGFKYKENGSHLVSDKILALPTEYTASKSISLKAGFHCVSNNFFSGKIVPGIDGTEQYSKFSACVNSGRMAMKISLSGLEEEYSGTPAPVSRSPVYPNPTSGFFQINLGKDVTGNILNTLGQQVQSVRLNEGLNQVFLDANLPSGIYRLFCSDGQTYSISLLR